MNELISYIKNHAERGECTCGKCYDSVDNPKQPLGHTANLIFFKVKAVNAPDKDELLQLIKSHPGEFNSVDLFDGKEHSYLEIGGWIGDQGLALTLMGLGELVGLWKLITPYDFIKNLSDKLAKEIAESGIISIKV